MAKTILLPPRISSILFGFVFLLLFVLGCQKNETPVGNEENQTAVLVPLAVGNQWSFIDSTFSAANGAFVGRDSSRLGITGSTSIQHQGASVEVFYWNWANPRTGVAYDYKWLTRNEPDGRYLYGGQSSKGTYVLGKFLSERHPVTAGQTWQNIRIVYRSSDSTFAVGDTVQMSCRAVDEQFTTLVETFKCVVYSYQQTVTTTGGTTIRETCVYYAPNIGYVGLVGYTNGVRDFKKTLSSYKLQ